MKFIAKIGDAVMLTFILTNLMIFPNQGALIPLQFYGKNNLVHMSITKYMNIYNTTMISLIFSGISVDNNQCYSEADCPKYQCCCWNINTCIYIGIFGCNITNCGFQPPTTTTVLPDFECDHHNPCPTGYCCNFESGVCHSSPNGETIC